LAPLKITIEKTVTKKTSCSIKKVQLFNTHLFSRESKRCLIMSAGEGVEARNINNSEGKKIVRKSFPFFNEKIVTPLLPFYLTRSYRLCTALQNSGKCKRFKPVLRRKEENI
jgi:hypothetical protein